MPDDDKLTAAIRDLHDAQQRHREALDRLIRHQAATQNSLMFPHSFTTLDEADQEKIRRGQ